MEELALANGIEEDARRISQRQKQIDYGKNTIAYDRFSAILPREKRVRGHPMTPIAKQKCSKRSFAGQVTSWKKKVYEFVAKLDLEEKAEKEEKEKAVDPKKDDGQKTAAESEKKDTDVNRGDGDATTASSDKEKEVSKEDVGNEDEDVFSDMDDIQLDDQGNVIRSVSAGDGKVSAVTEEDEEEEYSDMEDIELDDMGNVVTTSKTPPPSQGGDCPEKKQLENSPPSIFDVY